MTLARSALRHRLLAGTQALGIALADDRVDRLLDYLDLLQRWNRSFNLTAVRDPLDMVTRHLLDSLAITPWLVGERACDLGSGAGLPGVVLAIAEPKRAWVLVDANGKKARFLRTAVRELALTHVTVAQTRVQDVQGSFPCITARAFASMPDMLTWAGHLLPADGVWLAMKGQYPQDELDALPAGYRCRDVHALAVPGLDAERHLACIVRATA